MTRHYYDRTEISLIINPRYANKIEPLIRGGLVFIDVEWYRHYGGPQDVTLRLNRYTTQQFGGVDARMRTTEQGVTYDLQYTNADIDLPVDPLELINHMLFQLNNNSNNNNNLNQQLQTGAEVIAATTDAELLNVYTSHNRSIPNRTLTPGIYYIGGTRIHQLPEIESEVAESQSIANLIRNSHRVILDTRQLQQDEYATLTLDHHIIVVMDNPNAPTPGNIRNNFVYLRQWNDQGRSFRVFRNSVRLPSDTLVDFNRMSYTTDFDDFLGRDKNGNAYRLGKKTSPNNARPFIEVELPEVNNKAPFVEDVFATGSADYFFRG